MKGKALWIVAAVSLIMVGVIGVKTATTLNEATSSFTDDGYILTSVMEQSAEDTVNQQHYFSGGTSFKQNYDGSKISFKTNDGKNVSTDADNFIHYQSGSMSGFTMSVILDADDLDGNQIYSLPEETLVQKTGTGYSLNNAGENIPLSNFVWKTSPDQYMVVSKKIDLHTAEDDKPAFTFEDYVELQYKDQGIVYLVNQSGTQSTISSDAYLEMENGARVYIGSKNVSAGDEYKLNLASILVSPEDNSEIIPDEDYTIEVDKTPYVVVNVTDGEDGKAGESGIGGTEGTQGNGGKGGTQGPQGPSGTHAENSDVTYLSDFEPIFDVTLSPTSYGVGSNITYDSNSTSLTSASVIIRDTESGEEIFRKDITDDVNELAPFDGPQIDILKQDKQYSYVISATYTTDASIDEVTKNVVDKVFYTSTLGVELGHRYSTVDSIVADVFKTTMDGADKVRIRVYDQNMTLLGYAAPIEGDDLDYQDSGAEMGRFNIPSEMAVGESIPVMMAGLDANTPYYFQIEVLHLSGETQIIPTNSFVPQRYLTLKNSPLLAQPVVRLSEQTRSFGITAIANDYDNGIEGYRYEIYTTDGFENGAEPVTTIQKKDLNDLQLLIDETKVKRDVYYVCQIVGLFNDNYNSVEYRSPVSDPFIAGPNAWPSVEQMEQTMQITASTVEGTLVISDPSNTIIDCDAEWSLKVVVTPTASIGSGDVSRQTQEYIVDTDTISLGKASGGYYSIDYDFKALKEECNYTVTVYAHKMVVNGLNMGGANGVIIGTKSFTTTKYEPLYVRGAQKSTPANYFDVGIVFSPESEAYEATLESETSRIPSLGNLADFSGRSMTSVILKIYSQDPVNNGPSDTCIDTITFSDSNAHGYNAGNYAFNYQYDSDLFKGAYKRSSQGGLEDYFLEIKDSDFTVLTTAYMNNYKYDYMFIKVETLYDYTYGTGGSNFPIFGSSSNTIPVGDEETYLGLESNSDCWIPVELNVKEPQMPDKPYFVDTYLTKDAAEKKQGGVVTYYSQANNPSNNLNSSLTLQEMIDAPSWSLIKKGTNVGLQITGVSSLAKHASTARYKIYKYDQSISGSDKYVLVNESGWLALDATRLKMPTYTFFLDTVDSTTGLSASRGDMLKVEMEITLDKVYSSVTHQKMIWPTESETLPAGTKIEQTFTMSKENPSIRMIDYNSDANSTGTQDQLLLFVNDPDKAFEYTAADLIQFYDGDDHPVTANYQPSAQYPGFNLLTVIPSLPADSELTAKYRLLTYSTSRPWIDMPLEDESKIRGNRDVTFRNTAAEHLTSYQQSNRVYLQGYFDSTSGSNAVNVNLVFTKDGETIRVDNVSFTIVPIEETIGSDTLTYYEITASTPLSKLIRFAGKSGVSAEMEIVYDTGKSGISYLNGNHLLEFVDKIDENTPYLSRQAGTTQYIYPSYTLTEDDIILDSPVVADAYTIHFDTQTISYGSQGMEFAIKKTDVRKQSLATPITLGNIDPDVYVSVVTGYSLAKSAITISEEHSLNVASGLKYSVREVGTSTWTTHTLSLENGQYRWSDTMSGLSPDTQYEFKVEGYQYVNDELVSKTFKTGTFHTKSEIPFTFTNFAFVADKTSRSSKTAQATVNLTDVLYADVMESLQSVTFNLRDESNNVIGSASITPAQLAAGMSDEAKTDDSTVPGTSNYVVKLDWSPSVDEKHIMDGEHTYSISCSFNYKDGAQSSTKTLTATPDSWATFNGTEWIFDSQVPTITMIASTGVEADASFNYNYYVSFSVNGTDYQRLFTEVHSGETRYLTELHKVVGTVDTVVEYNSELISAQDVHCLQGVIAEKIITYNYMDPETNYYLKVYVGIDDTNIGTIGLDASSDLSCAFTAISDIVKTPASSNIQVDSIDLIPTTGQVKVTGYSLNYTKKIRYVLNDKTTNQQYTVVLTPDGVGDANLTTHFMIDSTAGSSNKYVLVVPQLNSPTHNYDITVYFYRTENASTPSTTKSGSYTYMDPNNLPEGSTSPLRSFLSGRLKSLLSFED